MYLQSIGVGGIGTNITFSLELHFLDKQFENELGLTVNYING
jgi:hypothetical protein